jgi:hypothetical protein
MRRPNYDFPVYGQAALIGVAQKLHNRPGKQNVVLVGFPLGENRRQVFEGEGRLSRGEQIGTDKKPHEVPGGNIQPVLEGVQFFPITRLKTEH